jgi:hypothetical protein
MDAHQRRARPCGANHVDGGGLAEQAGGKVEVSVHHVQRQGVQAEVVSRPEQRGTALDLQHLQGP